MNRIFDLLEKIDIDPKVFLISMFGSIIYATNIKNKISWVRLVMIMLSGAVISSYLSPLVCEWLEWTSVKHLSFVSMIIGMNSMYVLGVIWSLFDYMIKNPSQLFDLITKWKK